MDQELRKDVKKRKGSSVYLRPPTIKPRKGSSVYLIPPKNQELGTESSQDGNTQKLSNPTEILVKNGKDLLEMRMNSIHEENNYNSEIELLKSNNLPNISFEDFKKGQDIISQGTGVHTTTFLGDGTYNDTYKIEYENGGTYALRITKFKLEQSSVDRELYGLIVQSYLHEKCPENICKVYDLGRCTINGSIRVYALLEYLPIMCENHMSIKKCDDYFVEFKDKLLHKVFIGLFNALKCMHKNQFAHLDLKSENIGFDKENNVKLFDFGLSKHFPKNCGEVPLLCGTALYMDLNTFNEKRTLCIQSDVWSAGILLYESWYDSKSYDDCAWAILNRITNGPIKNIWKDFGTCVQYIKKYKTMRKVVEYTETINCNELKTRTEIYGLTTDQIEHIKFLITQILDAKFNSNDCLAYYIKNINNGSLNSIAAVGGKKRTIRRTTRKCTQNNSRKSRRYQRK